MLKKRVLKGGVWGLLLVLLTMASVGVTAQARTNFIFVRPQEIVSLDPAQVTESQSGFIIRNVYSRLVDISYDGTTVQPDLAEKWEVSEDGLTYTFHLHPNVKFQDGSILTASDVAYSLKRFISLGEGDSATFAPYLDAGGTEAVDDTTVKITLKAPFTAFLQVLGIPRGASIVSQKWVEANATTEDPWAAEYLASNAMGTGPYNFVEWIPSDHVTMTRFEDYYGGPAPIQEVVSLMNSDDTSTRLAMARGDVDAVQRLPDDVIRAINADKNLVIYHRPSYSSVFWVFQTQLKPFDDVRVRQAIIHAIDYDAIMNSMVQDGGLRMNTPVYASMQFHDNDVPLPTRDLALSRSLLADAGYPNGLDIDLVYVDFGLIKQLSVILQANLAEVGINAKLDEQPFSPFLDAAGNGQLGFYSWVSEPNYPQAIAILERFQSDKIGPGLDGNISYYSNPAYDEIMQQIRTTTDQADLTKLYGQAQEILANDGVWMLLYQEQLSQVAGTWVKGFDFGVFNYLDMRAVSISH